MNKNEEKQEQYLRDLTNLFEYDYLKSKGDLYVFVDLPLADELNTEVYNGGRAG